jgi:hypothetical protein
MLNRSRQRKIHKLISAILCLVMLWGSGPLPILAYTNAWGYWVLATQDVTATIGGPQPPPILPHERILP